MSELDQLICGEDLERWRIENGLTQIAAAHVFGLPNATWSKLTRANPAEPIDDLTVAMLLHIYRQHPDSVPIQAPADVKAFYEYLGLKDTVQDREKFSTLIGRSLPSIYRLLDNGKPSLPVLRWMEAVLRLKLAPQESLKLMAKIANNVGVNQVKEGYEN